MKPDLLILTSSYPNKPLISETWLADELDCTHLLYNTINIVSESNTGQYIDLPENVNVLKIDTPKNIKLNIKEIFNCLQIVSSDFFSYPNKLIFFKELRYNLSLIKSLHIKAKSIFLQLPQTQNCLIVYAYWADNLLTTSCILKQQYKNCYIISRAHGFEIFEDQTKFNMIPFRNFQNKFSNKIFADSKKGFQHLQKMNPNQTIFGTSYVGTIDKGLGFFDEGETFTILTCSNLTVLKRLHLMASILKNITFPLIWNIIGMGEDIEQIKLNNSALPKNITVNYIGSLTNKEVLEFMKKNHTNIFVSLSYSEGLPVTMMEAQSFGIPIMSTNVGGCQEICNEKTGFLINSEFNGKEVADNLTEFKNSTKNTLQFHKQCRQHWEMNFNAAVNYTKFATEVINFSA